MSPINLILNKYSVHVPSIARARLFPTPFLRRPLIYIHCHNGHDLEIKYPISGWEDAKKDFGLLQSEMMRVQTVLSPLVRRASAIDDSDSDSDSDRNTANDMK